MKILPSLEIKTHPFQKAQGWKSSILPRFQGSKALTLNVELNISRLKGLIFIVEKKERNFPAQSHDVNNMPVYLTLDITIVNVTTLEKKINDRGISKVFQLPFTCHVILRQEKCKLFASNPE